ncbi:MAG: hypothetical protein BRD55_05130 [Bacteroidetes bacterium SW_9_63_38]|nr:MAG: hypothetical protein BRD55_05130 [Bacteroidetes bacterium SW_9_63_38]
MSDASSASLQQLRAEWRERLRSACDDATTQARDLGLADLRALRDTIDEALARLDDELPAPGPVEAQGPVTAEKQAAYVEAALRYNALQVRRQAVQHELRRRALGPAEGGNAVAVPEPTRRYARLAWTVMGKPDVETPDDVYRAVAERAEEDVHLTTVERWLRDENPHHPDASDGQWAVLRRAVLLASADDSGR